MIRWPIVFLAAMCCLSCDRSPPPAPSKPASQPVPQDQPLPEMQCDVSMVTPLLPKRPTHIAVDPFSNIYYVQESDDGNDGVFVIGGAGISNATSLSTMSILQAMNSPGSGNIQSIAAATDGNIYFFFNGGTSRQAIICLGRLEPRSGSIRILARNDELASASGMGTSLTLARGTLVPAGASLWLWLQHSDASVMLNLRPGDFPSSGEIHLPAPTPIRSSDGTIQMIRADPKLSRGPGDSILLLDRWTAALWKIDLLGAADVMQSLVNLPQAIGAPAANSLGDIVMYIAPSDSIEPRVEQRVKPVQIDTHYPSLLVIRNHVIYPIPRDDIRAGPMFPVHTMELDQTIYEPGRDTWLGYDHASGGLVRLRISAKGTR
jgi:hypothetical protein